MATQNPFKRLTLGSWKDLVSFNLFFIHDDNYTKGFRIYKMLVFICRKLILTILITKIK
jgi:hypothetical protein